MTTVQTKNMSANQAYSLHCIPLLLQPMTFERLLLVAEGSARCIQHLRRRGAVRAASASLLQFVPISTATGCATGPPSEAPKN